ncbi:MAG TPA: efflux RND transporter permease subunit [Myxococcota bacterium]|nr:efflux RND transporter permease subunit [Myxococcota bacterium]
MRISQVCIDRPVLASVMSIVIVLFGLISVTRLQNRELPDIDPPEVSITTVFPGAAPEVVETSVTDVLEDEVNGIPGVKHVTSISREQVSLITIEFELSEDVEQAANDVRDRVARARQDLPEEIDDPIVAKRDADANADVWLALYGERYDQVELTQLAETKIVDRLNKLPGVATVIIAGERRYSMRLWVDNRVLGSFGLTISDVAAALGRENVDIPSGRVESENTEFTVRSLGELRTAHDFEDMIIGSYSGSLVRLRDVARVEVGAEDVRKIVRYNGAPAVGLGVVKQSKANTIDVATAVRGEVGALRAELPPGVNLELAFDASTFIRESIRDVSRTIFEAAILVVLVIYLFLRSVRATLIPAVAIPVSVLGAFAFLYFAGFTINTLTLMGVTLAIGLVVDDAIVVLENITRWVENGAPRLEAARRGMQEISFAVIAATVSSVAVFLPLTFLSDTTGRLFREFAVTVAAALTVSGFVAVTLSPALCAMIVQRGEAESGIKAIFARFFDRLNAGYASTLAAVMHRPARAVVFAVVWVLAGALLLQVLDEELVPTSDRGFVMVWTQAPEGSTIEYMDKYQHQTEQLLLNTPEVERAFSIIALGLGTPGLVNQGLVFAPLRDPKLRERSQTQVAKALGDDLEAIAGIKAYAHEPSPLRGFNSASVDIRIVGPDLQKLSKLGRELERRVQAIPGYGVTDVDLYLNKPQLEVAIDRERASDLGLSVRSIAETLRVLLGGEDLSTFKLMGETYDVMAQLGRGERNDPRDLLELFVRNPHGELISLSSVVNVRETVAPREINHYDRERNVRFTVIPEKHAQGTAIRQVADIAHSLLPPDGGYEVRIAGESESFIESGNALAFAYALAILIVYLVLAAQFESFVHPVTILVAVALSFTGALLALAAVSVLHRYELVHVVGTLNLYSKIGLVMLVGLVTKNSILIVEFANQLRERGQDLTSATLEAARVRFRPILMTALATMVGIIPIALGQGAGGDSRAPLGIAVLGGMFFSTILTFYIVPATYFVIERARERRGERAHLPHAVPVAGGR